MAEASAKDTNIKLEVMMHFDKDALESILREQPLFYKINGSLAFFNQDTSNQNGNTNL